ncbi:MAG: serine/threonine-protein kinase [Planctomycetota bacterium]|nr:serine/threonine-protein kinase [Planctomycetota bacterium]
MSKAVADPLAGRVFRGYRFLEKIASGGMGAVYVVVQESLGRKLAAKVLFQSLNKDPTNIARLRREALAAAQLSHPNIISVHDVFEDQGRHFLVMEYVEGESLLSVLRREKKLGLAHAIRILLQIASALDAAHKKGIIHRDIKPGNIMIDPKGIAKVGDFGIVKITSDNANLTQTGFLVGTPNYMSPEQALESKADPRTDIYSLGATIYEAITGRRPFEGRSVPETIRQHIEEPLRPPRDLDPKIPRWLSKLICKMMAKRPRDRFPSCSHLISHIRKLVRTSKSKSSRAPAARPIAHARPTSGRRHPPARASLSEEESFSEFIDATFDNTTLERIIDEEIERTGMVARSPMNPASPGLSEMATMAIQRPPPSEEMDLPETQKRSALSPTRIQMPAQKSAPRAATLPVAAATPAADELNPIQSPPRFRIAMFLILSLSLLAGFLHWEEVLRWGQNLVGNEVISRFIGGGDSGNIPPRSGQATDSQKPSKNR